MVSTPKQSKLSRRQKNYLKSNNWSSFVTVFNEVHNPNIKTMVGDVNVKATKKK
jgi:hypothetical protein